MSISKIRVKSAVIKQNDKTTKETPTTTTKTTTLPLKGTTNNTSSTTATTTFETSLSLCRESPKSNDQNKAKILPLSSNTTTSASSAITTNKTGKALNTTTAAVAATHSTHTAVATSSPSHATTTTILPQTNLLKIEPFVPSLTNRPQKTIRRSYSTLSNTTLKKHQIQHLNKNLVNQYEIQQQQTKALSGSRIISNNSKIIHGGINGLPKVLRQPTTLRRRPTLRGPINRQRSKSTSSSNSNSNRPITAGVNVGSGTPSAGTPCASPYSAIVVQQPNGICRIQRNSKEQDKLPDRINYDKRGLTAIPIFENETNLRLLSLQHNLINTFHIPREIEKTKLEGEGEQEKEKEKQLLLAETDTFSREQVINGISCRNVELNILGNQTQQQLQQPHSNYHSSNKQRLPLAVNKPNIEQLQPQVLGGQQQQLTMMMLPVQQQTNPMTFGSYILQRNKLLHRSINMNNCQVNNHKKSLLQHPAQLRFGMRKSKSFVSNLNLQLNLNKRSLQQQQKISLLRKTEANLKSFDSSTSNITTDSTHSTLLTNEMEETLVEDEDKTEEDKRSNSYSPLAIKNKQLLISYGNIFQNLVFLDLYDNQIERVSNLDGLPSLTVLLLGKNRISDISGLSSLKNTLRVLDLHGNKLCSISNKINCLKELKSLNLAGNQIRQINHNDFMGLNNLKELNLKRNKLKRINGFQHLLSLERLWLCHNDLHKVDDMSSIAKAENLNEITIENNPLTLAGDCVSFLVSYLPKLQTLSQMPITEQVRKAAMTWRANKELSEANSNLSNKEVFNIIRREEIISNARTNWELLRSQQMMQSSLKQQQQQKQLNPAAKSSATTKLTTELTRICESNECNYEEFIKLPPIENQQIAVGDDTNANKELEERSSSASSLGPNVNSSSSCYSSQDDEDDGVVASGGGMLSKTEKPRNNIDKQASAAISSSSSTTMKSKQQMENIINHTSSTTITTTAADNNHQHQHHSSSKCNNTITTLTPTTPTKAAAASIATTSNSAPTLNLQFPMETNKVSANQQNQVTVTSTTTSVSSSISSTQTNATIAMAAATTTVSSSMTVVTPATSATFTTKRYMTGSLMRSQTIVGSSTVITGAGASGGVAGGFMGGGVGGYTNGYMVKTNMVATANNIRYQQSKLNPNPTTQTAAAITTLQQTITTGATTTTGYSIANSNNNNSLIASSMNGTNNNTTTLHTNKTTLVAANSCSNSITTHAIQIPITATTTTTITTGPCGATSTKLSAIEREREQGGDYLIEICGRYLNIYGQGALRFIDKQWNPTKANDVHTLNFSYINFNSIASILARIKVRFVHAEHFVFRETNINCLGQLNALADLQGLTTLNIDDEGNPITVKDLWRQYAIYRLSHWGLKTLNGLEVTVQEIEKANAIFAGLSDLILWSMPDSMLQPLLTRLRLDESCTASKLLPKQWLRKPDNKSLRLVVGKEALQWKKSTVNETQHLPTPQQVRHLQNQYYNGDTINSNFNHHHSHHQTFTSTTSALSLTSNSTFVGAGVGGATLTTSNVALTTRERGKIHFTLMMENTCNAVEKLHKLEQIWPTMLQNIVRNTLLDYSQLDVYIRNLMAEIMK